MTILGSLRCADKLVSSVKDRKTAHEARNLCQTMTVTLLDMERSLPVTGAVNANGISPIQARKAELESEALQRGSTLEQEAQRQLTNKYQDIMRLAESQSDDQMSIFQQLDVLTGQVSTMLLDCCCVNSC